jgi:hypothetical protein
MLIRIRCCDIHDDISLMQAVIPGLIRNPGFFWIPAFAGMTKSTLTNVVIYKWQHESQLANTAGIIAYFH